MTQHTDGNAYWSAAWLAAFERLTDEKSLKRAANQVKKPGYRAELTDEGIRFSVSKPRGHCFDGWVCSQIDTSDKTWKWFLEDLAARSDLVASILCGELPAEVDELLEQYDISLVPSSPDDFSFGCDCPTGYREPCAHSLTAVQWMAERIARDPFALFEWNGIDLIAELRERGVEPRELANLRIPRFSDHITAAEALVPEATPEVRAGRTPEEILRSIPYALLGESETYPEAYLTRQLTRTVTFGDWMKRCRTKSTKWWKDHRLFMTGRIAVPDELPPNPDGTPASESAVASVKAYFKRVRDESRTYEYDFFKRFPDGPEVQPGKGAYEMSEGEALEEMLLAKRRDADIPDYMTDVAGGVKEAEPEEMPLDLHAPAAQILAMRLGRWRPGVRGLKLGIELSAEGTGLRVAVRDVDTGNAATESQASGDVMLTSDYESKQTKLREAQHEKQEHLLSAREIEALRNPVSFDRYLGALLLFTDLEAHELDPVHEAWRQIAVAAANLVTSGLTIPKPFLPDSLDWAMTRVLMFPIVNDPEVARVVTLLSAAVEPVAEKILEPFNGFRRFLPRALQQLPASRLDARFEFARRTTIAALAFASTAFLRFTNTESLSSRAGLMERLALGHDVSRLDGMLSPDCARFVFRGFLPMIAADLFDFRPVVMLTAVNTAAGFGLTFGIAPKNGNASFGSGGGSPSLPAGRNSVEPVPLSELVSDERWLKYKYPALQALEIVRRLCPQLDDLARHPEEPKLLTTEETADFLFKTAALLRHFGVRTAMPAELRSMVKPRLVARIGAAKMPANVKSYLTQDVLYDFDWRVAIGNQTIDADEFVALAKHKGKIVPLNGSFVYLDPAMVDELLTSLKKAKKPDYFEKFRAVLMGSLDGAEVDVSDVVERIKSGMLDARDRSVPSTVRATLRPYQVRGFSWLMKNIDLGMGSLIADDMGLGKTLQVITALAALKQEGRLNGPEGAQALVVAPMSLLTNWSREVERFAPELTTGLYHGVARELVRSGENAPDIILTTYGTLRSEVELLSKDPFRVLVIDEAQAVKNYASQQARAVRAIRADHVIAMTGTPVENRLLEYWSIFEIVQPKLLGSAADFQRRIAKPVEIDHDPEVLERFKKLTSPFMIRRSKEDKNVISDLPERTTIDTFTTLTKRQAELYKNAVDASFERLNELRDTAIGKKLEKGMAINSGDLRMKRRGEVLRLIGELKAICNSPSQHDWIEGEDGFHADAPDAPDSGKAETLIELLGRLHDAERKVIVFTQFRRMGELLQHWIERETGMRPDFLHGGVSRAGRQAMVDRFQTDRSARVIIVSLKAGGTGLNLTAASAVIHYDLWWNPAVEQQATDRAYRIGQRRDVLVYRFVTAGTFEEKINRMLVEKRELADLAVSAGETWIGDLPEESLRDFLSLSETF
ncbi:DEAD/DEAH box helicase [Sutterella megalosphaeroides]|uniref:Helicase n=1 Tax=Sutterella megalosphaeroides TaxID=2494234 RepID=A0A2Z6IA09_9BURK|nr:DEAD/DEAH box helicase [Sutterella megalosphaeroides]BBF23315.1 hypothetical protein SUTMEG_12060 [Sutterella megalosphaeroides]